MDQGAKAKTILFLYGNVVKGQFMRCVWAATAVPWNDTQCLSSMYVAANYFKWLMLNLLRMTTGRGLFL